ncbi:hypothetical protein VARIO8X_90095 [Burkholderiales bacterium 8X]|nr:hypothetical protein VARIO8X_90095 [Burkholderiales bacterium 8X]
MLNDIDENNFGARRRGFAALDPARRSAIAREGGRAAHEKGTAHQFSSDEARAAGLKSRASRRREAPAVADGATGAPVSAAGASESVE